MKTIIIADNGNILGKRPTTKCDLLVSLGDLYEFHVHDMARQYGAAEIIAVKGNHDSLESFDAPFIRRIRWTNY